MKKLIILCAVIFLQNAVTFAENTLHLGLYFPITNLNFDEYKISSTPVAGSLDYTHVAEKGFTWKIGLGFGLGETSNIKASDGANFPWLDFDLGAGFGYSFVHTEKLTLSLLGDIGLRIQGGESEEHSMFSLSSTKISIMPILYYIGPEVSLTYRLTKNFGLFANCGIFYVAGTTRETCKENGQTSMDKSFSTTGFIVQPKFGISLTF